MSEAEALTWHKSACNLCYINCGVELGVSGDGAAQRIVKVRGDAHNPRSQGYLCNKAQAIPSYVHHQDRLSTPLRRRADGSHEAIDWDTAVREIAERLGAVVAAHGGKTVAAFGGGGQGNHAGGSYAFGFLRALGSRTVFNALSQEKTGDFWLNGHLFGSQMCHTAEDIHHCDLLLVLGANPRLAHGFTNARDQLNGLRKDPQRKLIVVDPRRTETAEMADLHIALRPGTDAFLLGALLAELMRRNAFDEAFLAAHAVGVDEVKAALAAVPVPQWLAAADVGTDAFAQLVQMVMAAKAMVVRVELGIQQGLNSTLNSYLEKLLYLMTGHFSRPGTHGLHSWLAPLWGNTPGARHFATQAEVICGLLSPNVFPDAVLSDHPDRLRVLWVDSANPVNTAADTARVLQAMDALDLMVVVDVAYTETAAQADYVLPASSTYEKCEFTLFNFELPTNYFHVRAPVLPPLAGTLPEPEIYGRLARAMGLMPDDAVLAALRVAARDPVRFGAAFAETAAADKNVGKLAGQVLYETLGPTLPDSTAAAAPLWQACHRLARLRPQAVRQALLTDASSAAVDAVPEDGAALGERLFRTVVGARSGAAFSVHTSSWDFIEHADGKLHLAVPQMLDWLRTLDPTMAGPDPAWPFVLSAGQRRLNNANQILRDPGTRTSDPDGALYIHPDDLAALGVADRGAVVVETARARMVVRTKATDSMRRGHVALPHGYGQRHPVADGTRQVVGPPINWLTDGAARDPVADTPHHKHVPVRLHAAPDDAVLNSVVAAPAAAQ
ncbi:MAG: molybdopterin-dependent oxidoreductase [Rubrivivax sp.]|nr:molybdopterin-dependent oxidoreductase [Rubrivivax sp.]